MKDYKKYILSGLIILLITSLSFAQNRRQCQHREAIKAKRVAFITESLNLSVKEAQAFWPVFNDFSSKIESLRDKRFKEMNRLSVKSETLNSKDYQTFLNKHIQFLEEETKLKKEYQESLSKILSAKQIFLLYKSEKDFKRKLVTDLRKSPPPCIE